MVQLSKKLAAIPETTDEKILNEAKALIIRLKTINRRWNIDALDQFLKDRQRALFFNPNLASRTLKTADEHLNQTENYDTE